MRLEKTQILGKMSRLLPETTRRRLLETHACQLLREIFSQVEAKSPEVAFGGCPEKTARSLAAISLIDETESPAVVVREQRTHVELHGVEVGSHWQQPTGA